MHRFELRDGFETDDDLFALCLDAEGIFHDPLPGIRERFTLTLASPSPALTGDDPWLGDLCLGGERYWWNIWHATVAGFHPHPDDPSLLVVSVDGVISLDELPERPPDVALTLFGHGDEQLGEVTATQGIFRERQPAPESWHAGDP